MNHWAINQKVYSEVQGTLCRFFLSPSQLFHLSSTNELHKKSSKWIVTLFYELHKSTSICSNKTIF